ncbi:hypothetical protein CPB83DRAFT_476151 [Crepidotus variabilis]|uniref:RING-type domain-containing protein n=1 Tax=Crepidotus variabilis TaxID=179855 RepID=A0A9P6JV40_9AGAR|nr:hypothetical protein CPB83DRAFT_476151 [Crepidotus variabilis]
MNGYNSRLIIRFLILTMIKAISSKSHIFKITTRRTQGVVSAIDKKGKGKERVEPEDSPGLEMMTGSSRSGTSSTKLPTAPVANAKPVHEPLSSYTCPICFSAPTNATLTPCGHICCGECLFTAVKTTIHRATLAGADDASEAKCPVCRATIPGWDGKGGGVIGLKPRAIFSL